MTAKAVTSTSESPDVLITNARIVTMNQQRDIIEGDVFISKGLIQEIGQVGVRAQVEKIDARGKVVVPGLIQGHIHLCQTLFRGQGDDLRLADWLRTRIWPLEGAHDDESSYASALLGCAELIKGGTTAILDMESVYHCEPAFHVIEQTGIRATVGKSMRDFSTLVPPTLRETTEQSIQKSVDYLERWHGKANGRIRYAFAPMSALSNTKELLGTVRDLAEKYDVRIHSHAGETKEEIQRSKAEHGCGNVELFERAGLTGCRLSLAHCVWLSSREFDILRSTGTKVLHCPSSNMKLGSGFAKVARMLRRGIPVAIGADGAGCNNNLDIFTEMRLAALIQSVRSAPGKVKAAKIFEMATRGGAAALGLEKEIGSIEKGKRADLTILDLDRVHTIPSDDMLSTIVYSGRSTDVQTVIIDGRVVMRDRKLLTVDEEEVKRAARKSLEAMKRRAGLS